MNVYYFTLKLGNKVHLKIMVSSLLEEGKCISQVENFLKQKNSESSLINVCDYIASTILFGTKETESIFLVIIEIGCLK